LLDVPVGSRVLIAIAPQDAFQAQGGIPDAGIEADDTIIFVVDVLDATTPEPPLARAEGTAVEPDEGLPTVELDDTGKPTITIPDGDPPTEQVTQVLIEGDGPEVESGQTITAHYTGVIWASGEQFDSSWDRGEPSEFPIGVGGVIVGWDEGLVGQTVGSQILLVIPPDQGYGPDGNPDAGIAGTDTLVFVVDILAAN
ncbi:MAG: FKBP-type peptidyl-prolyl cis-trans isomerase, partial [Acidimicrobiales bacterium]